MVEGIRDGKSQEGRRDIRGGNGKEKRERKGEREGMGRGSWLSG